MCIKKRLGKYRNSEQQFNTCSAVSCIYWTFDVIISSAVGFFCGFLFFSQRLWAYMPWFHSGVWKKCKRCFSDLIVYEEVEKNSYLDRAVARFMVRKESWTPESGLKSLYPPLQTLFTQLWPNHAKLGQKTWTNVWSPLCGICDPWGHNTHTHAPAHTRTQVCHGDQTTPADRMEGRTQLQGCGKKWKGLCKTCCWARNTEWQIYQGNLCWCNVCEQVAVSSPSHCWHDLPDNPPCLVLMLFSLDARVSVFPLFAWMSITFSIKFLVQTSMLMKAKLPSHE